MKSTQDIETTLQILAKSREDRIQEIREAFKRIGEKQTETDPILLSIEASIATIKEILETE
jgi:hypothetical protein